MKIRVFTMIALLFMLAGCAGAAANHEEISLPLNAGILRALPTLAASASGNMKVIIQDEQEGELTGIFDALNELEYQPYTCDGLPEYQLTAADGTIFYINLSDKWVWRGYREQAELSDELSAQLKGDSNLVICLKLSETPET